MAGFGLIVVTSMAGSGFLVYLSARPVLAAQCLRRAEKTRRSFQVPRFLIGAPPFGPLDLDSFFPSRLPRTRIISPGHASNTVQYKFLRLLEERRLDIKMPLNTDISPRTAGRSSGSTLVVVVGGG